MSRITSTAVMLLLPLLLSACGGAETRPDSRAALSPNDAPLRDANRLVFFRGDLTGQRLTDLRAAGVIPAQVWTGVFTTACDAGQCAQLARLPWIERVEPLSWAKFDSPLRMQLQRSGGADDEMTVFVELRAQSGELRTLITACGARVLSATGDLCTVRARVRAVFCLALLDAVARIEGDKALVPLR
jgi:hypothetical protein